jgi:hypothetical protein
MKIVKSTLNYISGTSKVTKAAITFHDVNFDTLEDYIISVGKEVEVGDSVCSWFRQEETARRWVQNIPAGYVVYMLQSDWS